MFDSLLKKYDNIEFSIGHFFRIEKIYNFFFDFSPFLSIFHRTNENKSLLSIHSLPFHPPLFHFTFQHKVVLISFGLFVLSASRVHFGLAQESTGFIFLFPVESKRSVFSNAERVRQFSAESGPIWCDQSKPKSQYEPQYQ